MNDPEIAKVVIQSRLGGGGINHNAIGELWRGSLINKREVKNCKRPYGNYGSQWNFIADQLPSPQSRKRRGE
jgi:hypothetical protein